MAAATEIRIAIARDDFDKIDLLHQKNLIEPSCFALGNRPPKTKIDIPEYTVANGADRNFKSPFYILGQA